MPGNFVDLRSLVSTPCATPTTAGNQEAEIVTVTSVGSLTAGNRKSEMQAMKAREDPSPPPGLIPLGKSMVKSWVEPAVPHFDGLDDLGSDSKGLPDTGVQNAVPLTLPTIPYNADGGRAQGENYRPQRIDLQRGQ